MIDSVTYAITDVKLEYVKNYFYIIVFKVIIIIKNKMININSF